MLQFQIRLLARSLVIFTLLAAPSFAGSSISVDVQNELVLTQDDAGRPWHPASLTKMMTALIVFDLIAANRLSLSDPVVMSTNASQTAPSKLGLGPGDSILVKEALTLMLTRSMNDLAVALAEKVAGTEANFAKLMNLRAKSLGMTGTHFKNASGLHQDGQVSTAADIAKLAVAIIRTHPSHLSFFNHPSVTFRGKTYRNTNGLVRKTDWTQGLKTGYVCASGYNLANLARIDGREIVTVVLGASNVSERERVTQQLTTASLKIVESHLRLQDIQSVGLDAPDLRLYQCGKRTVPKLTASNQLPKSKGSTPSSEWITQGDLSSYKLLR
jgi:D-alanyl-D-alanine carboxypeptidase